MKRMHAVDANRVFLVSIIVSQCLIYALAYTGLQDEMSLQFMNEVFLAVPGLYYLVMKKQEIKRSLEINAIGWRSWLLLLPFAVCVDKIAQYINVLSQLFTENRIGEHMLELILAYPFPIAFFVIAVTPAVCEELLFRGVLYRGYRKNGLWVAVFLSAFLFGIMHMNLNQFFYAFAVGIIFALVNEVTGSILPSFFLHLYMNGRSTVLLFLMANSAEGVQAQYSIKEECVRLLPVFLVAVAGAGILFYFLFRCGKKRTEVQELERKKEKGNFAGVVSPELILGIGLCIVFMLI